MYRAGQVALLLLTLLLAGGCGEIRPQGAPDHLLYHTVRPGETLYSIAFRYGYDFHEVAAWNRIASPYTIYPGDRLMLIAPFQGTHEPPPGKPAAGHTAPPDRAPVPAVATAPKASAPVPTIATKPVAKPASSATVRRRSAANKGQTLAWRWPTKGKVTATFDVDSKKGVKIAGRLGQPVVAAAGGAVVYSGNGLIGYGNLVIIKHDETWLSAYGHNRKLLVKEGDSVVAGEKIAEMGQNGKEGSILHFQIRRNGRPVDPLKHLSKR